MIEIGVLGICLLLAAILAALALLFHKVRRIHVATFELMENTRVARRETESLFAQLQCLFALERTLGLDKPLPPMRGWAGSPDFLLNVARQALTRQPKVVVECSSGVSTLVLARCLQLNRGGHVFSLEHEPLYAAKTRALLREHGVDSWATVLDAPLSERNTPTPWYSEESWPDALVNVDLLVVDGPPESTAPMARYPALPRLLPRMSTAFVVIVDDADRPDETEMVSQWVHQIPGLVATRVSAEKGLALLERSAPPPLDCFEGPQSFEPTREQRPVGP